MKKASWDLLHFQENSWNEGVSFVETIEQSTKGFFMFVLRATLVRKYSFEFCICFFLRTFYDPSWPKKGRMKYLVISRISSKNCRQGERVKNTFGCQISVGQYCIDELTCPNWSPIFAKVCYFDLKRRGMTKRLRHPHLRYSSWIILTAPSKCQVEQLEFWLACLRLLLHPLSKLNLKRLSLCRV